MKNTNYRIKPYFSIVVHSPNRVELRKGIWNSVSYTLNDDVQTNKLAKIILDLNGSKTVSELSKLHDMKRSEIEAIIDHLRRLDVIEMGSSNLIDYYIEEAQLPFPGFNLEDKQSIVLLGDQDINEAIMQQVRPYCVHHDQIRIMDPNDSFYQSLLSGNEYFEQELSFQKDFKQMKNLEGSLVVLTAKVINPNLFLKFNRLAFESGINWMHGCIDGPMLYIGPMFFAERGPCYYCFEKRVSMNVMENNSYIEYKKAIYRNEVSVAQLVTPILINLLASHLGMEIINYLLTRNTYLCNRVLSIYLPTKEIGYNELLRFPDCPVCGSICERDSKATYFDTQVMLEEA